MSVRIDMGADGAGAPVFLDLEELLATRLLVQGNSGSGKSHLLRRLVEGRTFLDIDMARAADLLGMERRQAEQIRDLARGQFLALGRAISRRPIAIRIGDVRTGSRGGGRKLMPLPDTPTEDSQSLLFGPSDDPPSPPPPPRPPVAAEEILRTIARPAPAEPSPVPDKEREEIVTAALAAIAADPDAAFQTPAILYQDFLLRCRMRRLTTAPLDLAEFRRWLGMARAGISDDDEEGWADALAMMQELPEEMTGAFLLVARAAKDGAKCPADEAIGGAYGTRSPGAASAACSNLWRSSA